MVIQLGQSLKVGFGNIVSEYNNQSAPSSSFPSPLKVCIGELLEEMGVKRRWQVNHARVHALQPKSITRLACSFMVLLNDL